MFCKSCSSLVTSVLAAGQLGNCCDPHKSPLISFLCQVHHINANYFLDITSMKPEDVESSIFSFSTNFEDPSTATYLQFLKEGLQRAKPYLQP